MTVPNNSIPVELNGGFRGSNLAKCRSLIFGLIFLTLFLWQRMHFLPTCFIIDLPFKIQYILLMFDRIYSGPRSPWLWYFLTIGVVIWCSVGKIIWYFHSYGIFAHFSPPLTLIMPFSWRNGLNSFNLPFFISSLLSSRVYPPMKDSLWTNLIITSSDFFVSEALKISFNFLSCALQLAKNLVTHAVLWNSLEAYTDGFLHFM